MERYIVFIKDTEKGEEFITVRQAEPNSHFSAMQSAAKQYKQPRYKMLTTYTESELQEILNSVERWCGGQDTAVAAG